MDIFNTTERQVVCIRNDNDVIGSSSDNHKLVVGEKYTVDWIDVHSWHTMIGLREFPGSEFNSVLFEEIEEANE